MKKVYYEGESKALKRIVKVLNRKPETGEGHEDAYYGDYSKEAYEHSQLRSGNPHNVTPADLGLERVQDEINAIMQAIGAMDYWESNNHGYITDDEEEKIEFETSARILEYD